MGLFGPSAEERRNLDALVGQKEALDLAVNKSRTELSVKGEIGVFNARDLAQRISEMMGVSGSERDALLGAVARGANILKTEDDPTNKIPTHG